MGAFQIPAAGFSEMRELEAEGDRYQPLLRNGRSNDVGSGRLFTQVAPPIGCGSLVAWRSRRAGNAGASHPSGKPWIMS
jgi:hypothetical protein